MTDTPNNPQVLGPVFSDAFRMLLRDLVLWRRDVRRFKRDPVDAAKVAEIIDLACHAPSVGHCQPWRFVLVEDSLRREAVRQSFKRANADALNSYDSDQKRLYSTLKLEGLDAAPVQIAVFADETTNAGSGLGRRTMPEMLRYSVVGAIQTLWLAARAEGLGVGWVSILEPAIVTAALDVPAGWRLIAYLCIGYPEEEHLDPELDRSGWQARVSRSDLVLKR